MDQEKAKQISECCMELSKARAQRKLSQDQLDYELAKLCLDFINDYAPRSAPTPPHEVAYFLRMNKEERNRLELDERQRIEGMLKNWRSEKSIIEHGNSSHLRWLIYIEDILRKNNHQDADVVKTVIYEHQQLGVAA